MTSLLSTTSALSSPIVLCAAVIFSSWGFGRASMPGLSCLCPGGRTKTPEERPGLLRGAARACAPARIAGRGSSKIASTATRICRWSCIGMELPARCFYFRRVLTSPLIFDETVWIWRELRQLTMALSIPPTASVVPDRSRVPGRLSSREEKV